MKCVYCFKTLDHNTGFNNAKPENDSRLKEGYCCLDCMNNIVRPILVKIMLEEKRKNEPRKN